MRQVFLILAKNNFDKFDTERIIDFPQHCKCTERDILLFAAPPASPSPVT